MGRVKGALLGVAAAPLVTAGGALLGAGIAVAGATAGALVVVGSSLAVIWAPVVGAKLGKDRDDDRKRANEANKAGKKTGLKEETQKTAESLVNMLKGRRFIKPEPKPETPESGGDVASAEPNGEELETVVKPVEPAVRSVELNRVHSG